ncbi:MAG: YbaB/EbfC family nucleoid-associated protein [Patescibacteria group bacterium]|nr:YbaB/EbfC family nucleoid-associated protein [Patescibacteria group bacterium]
MFEQLKNLASLRKQASEMKKQLESELITGESLNGQVKISMDGSQKIKEVFIDESLLEASNQDKLQNAIKDAFSKANKELQMMMVRKMQAGEIQMPQM